ncbi:hypothetical protein RGC28_08275, partial [Helicobacter pylori]|uniref:hypothetical protein n=1 Tax=Helicobacter pylori TaxID=210 RepID=UPI00292933EC
MLHSSECNAAISRAVLQIENCDALAASRLMTLLSGVTEVIAEKLTFIPKGGMCISCAHKNDI